MPSLRSSVCQPEILDLARRHVLELEEFPLAVAQQAFLVELPAGLLEQRARLQQVAAQPVGGVLGARGAEGRAEDAVRQRLAERLEQRELARPRRALRGELAVVEQAVGALVEAGLEGVLEVVAVDQRLAHPDVLEQRPPHVEDVRLHQLPEAGHEAALDDAAVVPLRALVQPQPRARAVLLEEVELARLEGLARDGVLRVVAVDDAIEVEVAAAHAEARDGVGPVVRVADELDPARHVDLADHVRPGGDRVLGDDLRELLPLAPLAAEDRQRAGDEQLVARALPQVEAHRPRVDDLHALDSREDRLVRRRRLLRAQRVEAVLDVRRRDRVAVREARLAPDAERDRREVGRDEHRLGEQCVHRRRLVGRQVRQALDHPDRHARGRVAAGRERVELVEAGAAVRVAQPQRGAARRVRIDVLEVREALRVLGVAERGECVHPAAGGGRGAGAGGDVRAAGGQRRVQGTSERRTRHGDGKTAAQQVDRVQRGCTHVRCRGRRPFMSTRRKLNDGGVLWKAAPRSNPGRQPACATASCATGSCAAATARPCRPRAGSARAPARTSGRTAGSGTGADRR